MNLANNNMFCAKRTYVPRGRLVGINRASPASLDLHSYADWPSFWRDACRSLRHCGYSTPTLRFYRHILRAFVRFTGKLPNAITRSDIFQYLRSLTNGSFTWHWTGMNVSVLRVLFDKLCHLQVLTRQRGPRRKRAVPGIIDRENIANLLAAAPTTRDQIIIALLYGCGLRTGELRNLIWANIDPDSGMLALTNRYNGKRRQIRLPEGLITLLQTGKKLCSPEHYVIPGSRVDKPCSTRAIQRSISACVRVAIQQGATSMDGLAITPMTLRHSYAVHFLESGGLIHELQELLGHLCMETTQAYEDICRIGTSKPPTIDLPINPAWSSVATPAFPLTQRNPSYGTILKTRLKEGFFALRQFWSG